MKQVLLRPLAACALLALGSLLAFGQGTTTGSISGTIADQTGAVVGGATVVARNNETGIENTVQTADNGTFSLQALPAGTYTVTITAPNFKKSVVQDVKVNIGTASSINVGLEVGDVGETVTITGAGGELLQTQSATVGTTITGRQITDLPFTSRDALDLVLLLPGTQTPGRPRQSTVNGLPKGALNITLDGLNVQDNLLKSNDGFFTYVRPRIDAIEEVTLSTATPGAESSGEGAVQIKFSTRSGTNEFHGSLYEYHRNPSLNANFFFNNQLLAPDPVDGTAPRNRILLNQYGGRVGGPITIPKLFDGRDKAFFFINYEEFRLPERSLRTRTIFNPTTATGIYQYVVGGQTRTVNLLALAAAAGLPSTIDPTISTLMSQMRSAVTSAGGGINQLTDPNLQSASFINPGGQDRFFPTGRFDFNLGDNHHVEYIGNYQDFNSTVDFLNGADPAFPGFPNFGSQSSNRWSQVAAHRWTITPTIVNEARLGFTGGVTLFFGEVSPAQFDNQNGFNLNAGFAAGGHSGATVITTPQRRNTPVKQFSDNLSWVKGTHSFNFGGSYTRVHLFSKNAAGGIVPAVTFGVATNDTAVLNALSQATIPGASSTQVAQAQGIYAMLTGRITNITNTLIRDEETGNFAAFGDLTQRAHQQEFGIYAQDTWRFRPNLTLTLGLRNEVQFAPITENINFTTMQGGDTNIFGVSCSQARLFNPGGATCDPTAFVQLPVGSKAWNDDWINFAPSVGFAYTPNWKGGLLGRFFGEGGQTVFRGGYSIAYIREGNLNLLLSIYGSNQGATQALPRSVAGGQLSVGNLFRNIGSIPAPNNPASPAFPIVTSPATAISVNSINPDLKMGYAQSWTFGIQRELTKDMVFEARYVGTRGKRLQHQYDFNETNVLENGFIDEFRLARQNFLANIAAGRGANFRYFGPNTGTAPLPVIFGLITGQPTTNAGNCNSVATCNTLYSNALFANTVFTNQLAANAPSAIGFANVFIANPATFPASRFTSAGVPRNFFIVNPDARGGVFTVDNSGASWYDGMTLELRRRMADGLLLQGSYTWSKSQSLGYSSSSVLAWQPRTLRDLSLDKTAAPFDIRHAFKMNYIYELPFGRGKKWLDGIHGFLDGFVGGWELHGTARIQSGSPVNLGNVQLVGMTRDELQDAVEIRKDPNKTIFWLPQDIIDNTIRAFNVTNTGFALGTPTGRYISPANSNGCIQAFSGQCGFAHLVIYGPRFVRYDMSVVKKVRFTENTNLEMRAEFLNLPNAINFMIGSAANDVNTVTNFGSQAFGQTTQAYQDLSTTNDPGGRLIQLVVRFNF
jgi:Carboxypeptidase regulatory-like domain/TonB dependent receptor